MAGHECIQRDWIKGIERDVDALQKTLNGKMDKVNESLGEIHEKINEIAEATVAHKVKLAAIIGGISILLSAGISITVALIVSRAVGG